MTQVLGSALAGAVLALSSLVTTAPAAASAPQEQIGQMPLQQWVARIRVAREACAWTELAGYERIVREQGNQRSDAWMEAAISEAIACYHLGQNDEMRHVAGLVEEGALEREGDPAEVRRAGYEPLNRVRRLQLALVRANSARLLQGEGEHEEALARLVPLLEVWRQGGDEARESYAETLLDVARSLAALGRGEEAAEHLRFLRDRMPDQPPSAVAGVLLQQGPEGLDAYRGRYEGCPEHRARMEAVQAALPAARRELARVMEREEESLPRVPVGVVDRPEGMWHAGGFTEGGSRGAYVPLGCWR